MAPTSAVATRATVRAAEPVMFGGSAKAKPAPKAVRKATKKVAKKAAPAPKKGKPAPKPAAKARKVGKLSKLCLTQVQLGDELGVAMDMVGRVYTFGGCAPSRLPRPS